MPGTRTTINLRANQGQRALIDQAREMLGKNRSDFMLEAACREADTVLLDRRLFWGRSTARSRRCRMMSSTPLSSAPVSVPAHSGMRR